MPNMNIDHAATNLRWASRAWKDGEMRALALFLFRKGLSQLVMEDISLEIQVEIAAAHLGREAFEDLSQYNDEVNSNPVLYAAWKDAISCLIIC